VKTAAATVSAIVALVAILLLVMWLEHRTEITLPTPTGPFAVERTTYGWESGAHQVRAWIWYPATHSRADVPADYLPPQWRAALAQQMGVLMRSFF
jgi:hypothetical protein